MTSKYQLFSFSESDIQLLQKKGLFKEIALKIKSTRKQTNDTISTKYVSLVLRGKIKNNSSVTIQIVAYASKFIKFLKDE
jgi:hypothetical protein